MTVGTYKFERAYDAWEATWRNGPEKDPEYVPMRAYDMTEKDDYDEDEYVFNH
jgi:hypothetical protein